MPLNPVAIYESNLGSTGNSLGKRDSHVFLGGEEVSQDGDFVPKKGRVTITGKLDYDTATAGGSTFTNNTLVPKSYVDTLPPSVTVVNNAGAPSSNDEHVYSCLASNSQFAPTSHTHAIADVTGLQADLNGKAPLSHTHTIANVTGLQTELNAKAPLSHTHTIANVTGLQTELNGKALASHTHTIANVTGLQTELNGKALASHTHTVANVTGLQDDLDGKAPLSHVHTIANVTGLQTELNGKALSSHTHAIANVTGLQAELNGKALSSHTHTIAQVTSLQPSLDAKLGHANIKNYDSAALLNGDFSSHTMTFTGNVQYPPALSNNTSTVSGITYTLSASTNQIIGSSYDMYKAFDRINGTGWHTLGNYNSSNNPTTMGQYQGSNSLGGVNGEWIQIQMSSAQPFGSVKIIGRQGKDPQAADSWEILASNNGSSWTSILQSTVHLTYNNGNRHTITINNTTSYTHYAMIAKTVAGPSTPYLTIHEIEFYTAGGSGWVETDYDSTTAIPGIVISRTSSGSDRLGWFVEHGGTPWMGHGNPYMTLTNPDSTNMIGLKDCTNCKS